MMCGIIPLLGAGPRRAAAAAVPSAEAVGRAVVCQLTKLHIDTQIIKYINIFLSCI